MLRLLFVPLLVLGAVVVPCWLAFRLYRHRARGRPLSLGRELLLLTFVLYLLALAAVTLTPNRGARRRAEPAVGVEIRPNLASLTCTSPALPGGSNARAFCRQNAVGNVLLFFPLGILIPLVWGRLRFRRGIWIAVALSIGIELAQYVSRAWGSHRSADVNDVLLNGTGACLGLALMFLLRARRGAAPAVPRAG